MRFAQTLVALAVVALASAASAQQPVFQLKVDVPLVSVDVRVLDGAGAPITSLSVEDFIVSEDGVEQQVRHFNSVETPYNILLLFDRSGSTEGQWSFMQRAATRFMRNLRPQDRLALGAFDEGTMMLSTWSDPLTETERALQQLPDRGPGGGTNFYQALERVTQREFRNTTGRRAVVVLSDGRDSGLATRARGAGLADARFARTYAVVQRARVPIYFVALNTDKNLTGGNAPPQALLAEVRTRMELLANVTGGAIFFPRNMRDVVSVYDQVGRDLSSSYTLGYVSNKPAVPGETHRIEIRVHGAKVKQSRETYVTP